MGIEGECSASIYVEKVARAGLEPARHYWQGILSPQRLPIPPPSHKCYSAKNRRKKRSLGRMASFFTLDFSLARDLLLSTFPLSSARVGPLMPHLRVEFTPQY